MATENLGIGIGGCCIHQVVQLHFAQAGVARVQQVEGYAVIAEAAVGVWIYIFDEQASPISTHIMIVQHCLSVHWETAAPASNSSQIVIES